MVDYRCTHSTPYVPYVFRCFSECYDIYMRMGGLTTERTETDDEAKLKLTTGLSGSHLVTSRGEIFVSVKFCVCLRQCYYYGVSYRTETTN